MGSCDGSSHNQQWLSTDNGKFLHIKSGLCLGISNSSRGPYQPAVATPCAQAPRWTCHAQEGFLEVENTSLFLKKQYRKVVVKKISKYLDSWMKLDLNKDGRLVNESLCLKQAGLGTEVSVRIARNSAAPQIPTTSNTVPYSPDHISNTTETFLRSTAETLGSTAKTLGSTAESLGSTAETLGRTVETLGSTAETYSQSSSKRDLPSLHTAGTTDTSWSSSTTPPFSSTTTEVKGEGAVQL